MSDDLMTSQWKNIREKAGSYSPEAFQFVRDGLAHTVKLVHGDGTAHAMESQLEDESRHVSGQQLCLGLRDYALRQYGMLALTVLHRWGIHRTEDFGRIVFAMIEGGLMRKTDQDTLDDFQGVFEFDDAFSSGSGV